MKKLKLYLEWMRSTCFGYLHQYKYCSVWDKKLNELIDLYGDKAEVDEYNIELNGNLVWISNRMYSYGFLYQARTDVELPRRRPSIKTMIKLAKLEDEVNEKKIKKSNDNYKESYKARISEL